jgi:hypothetical protein
MHLSGNRTGSMWKAPVSNSIPRVHIRGSRFSALPAIIWPPVFTFPYDRRDDAQP